VTGEDRDAKTLDSSPSNTSPGAATAPAPAAPPPDAKPDAKPADSGVQALASPQGDGGRKPPTPDPVREAIAFLAKPGSPDTATATPTDASKPPEAKSRESAEKPEGTAKPAEPDLSTDPYAGWLTPEQRALLKPQTRERIETIHARWKAAEAKLAEAESAPKQAHEFDELITAEALDEDVGFVEPAHLAGLIRLQAAINRGAMALQQGRQLGDDSVQAVEHLERMTVELRQRLGMPPAPPKDGGLTPHQGELPSDLRDLVDIYGVPETEARLLAGIRARQRASAPPAAQPAPPVQPRAAPAAKGVDFEQIEARRGFAEMAKDGITADRYAAHQQALMPLMRSQVAEMYPGLTAADIPAVFNALPARTRTDMLIKAHRDFLAKKQPVSSPPALPPPTTKTLTGVAHRATATPKPPQDPVESAIAYLARPPASVE
jgi:hypothetical protein